ncbi:MAG: hypothetical protein WA081_06895 [Desulfosalsimonadaceae bacterium]
MAKNKRKKTSQNKNHELFKTASADELLHHGTELLNSGKYRDAIETLKMAAKKSGTRNEIDPLLFKAYSFRAAQLREKGLHVEAASVNQLASALMPSYHQLTEQELLPFIKTSGIRQAVSIYSKYLGTAGASESIETWLAELFLVHQQWDILELLTDKAPLKRDAQAAMTATCFMNKGEWESGLEALKLVPRSSPWSTLRLMCHAMVCFYKEDNAGMQRALSMIPANSAFKAFAGKMAENNRTIACLWDGPVHLESDALRILEEIRHKRFKGAENFILKTAAHVYPREPARAAFHILELLWFLVLNDSMKPQEYFKMGDSLLPKDLARLLKAKIGSFAEPDIPFLEIKHYLPLLNIEFPKKEDQDIAAGCVILHSIKQYKNRRGRRAIPPNAFEDLKTRLNLTSATHEGLLAESLVSAIQYDPDNRQIYEFLVSLPSVDRESKNWIEQGLLRMNAHFPEDPFPCLELARLYYTKNAFRKAETILNEAVKRAPHDIRVVNMRVMSLLISADKNFKRRNMEPAAQDIEKAEALDSPNMRFLVAEKKMLLKLAGHGQMSLFKNITLMDPGDAGRVLDELLRPMLPVERLKALGVLYLEVKNSGHGQSNGYVLDAKLVRVVDQILCRHLAGAHQLTHSELVILLSPLSLELPVIPIDNLAGLFIEKAKAGLLKLIDDHHLLPIFDSLTGSGHYQIVQQEIKRRKKTAPNNFSLLLRFYEVAVRHFTGELTNDNNMFWDIIDQVPKDEIGLFRLASRRLAGFAENKTRLKKALSEFDFDLLSSPYYMDYEDEFDNWEDDDEFDDDELNHDLPAANAFFVSKLEKLAAASGLKGAPVSKLIKLRNEMMRGPFPMDFNELGKGMDKTTIQNLSREARILIFGKA